MKKTVFILFALIILASTQAQELVVASPFQVDLADLSAASVSGRRVDANGKNCALIKVRLVDPEASFEGNVIEVEYKKGEWWVYLMEGSMNLTIKTHSNLPFEIKFEPLKSLCTYTIMLRNDYEVLFPYHTRKGVGWINSKGEEKIFFQHPKQFKKHIDWYCVTVGKFNDGVALVEYRINNFDHPGIDRRFWHKFFVNKEGIAVSSIDQFYDALPFSEGLAAVKTDKGWGYINTKGEYVIPPKYKVVTSFDKGTAYVVRKDSGLYKLDIIDKNQDIKFSTNLGLYVYNSWEFVFYWPERIRASHSQFGNREWKITESLGKWEVVPVSKNDSSVFYDIDGFDYISYEDKNGFYVSELIDKTTGEKISKADGKYPFHDLLGSRFSEGIRPVEIYPEYPRSHKKEIVYIDKTGRIVLSLKGITDATPFYNGLANVRFNTIGTDLYQKGYIDKSGRVIFEYSYIYR